MSHSAMTAQVAPAPSSRPADTTAESAASTPLLAVRQLCLSLGKRIVLDDVTFTLQPGEMMGILGPNGSGKTSLMRCLTGLLRPDRGTIQLLDAPLTRTARSQMGVVFQEPSLDPKLSARENLMLGAALFGIRGSEAKQRAKDLLQFIELEDRAQDLVSSYSGGMRRRLELARALISRPQLLLLDEPTTGLDMRAFEKTWQRMRALRKHQELSVLVSTHLAEEAAQCDRLLIMDRGRVVTIGTPAQLLDRVSGDVIEMEVEETQHAADCISSTFGIVAHVEGNVVKVEREEGHTWIPKLVEALEPGSVKSVSMHRPTLADAFFALTGHALDPEGLPSPQED